MCPPTAPAATKLCEDSVAEIFALRTLDGFKFSYVFMILYLYRLYPRENRMVLTPLATALAGPLVINTPHSEQPCLSLGDGLEALQGQPPQTQFPQEVLESFAVVEPFSNDKCLKGKEAEPGSQHCRSQAGIG